MGKAVVDVFLGWGGGDDVVETPPPTALEKFCRACWIDSWVAMVLDGVAVSTEFLFWLGSEDDRTPSPST